MKKSRKCIWVLGLLLVAGCAGPKNVSPEDPVDALKLKDYDPVSVFVMEEHHPSAARFSTIDMHSHAYRNDEAGIRQWVKTLDENNIEKVIVHTKAFGEEFDRLYDLFTGISDKFEVWCGFDMTKWDQPEFPECAVKELERCFAKGAGGVGELIDKGLGERISSSGREVGLHFNDPKFDALFEKCVELGMPVSIHSGDPIWMYEPLDSHNDGYMNAKHWWIDLSVPGTLDLDGVVHNTHLVQHGSHVRSVNRGLHVILHGEAAGEIDTQVDAHTEEVQEQGSDNDNSGDDQANSGTILDNHYASTSFSASAFTLV